MNNKLRLLNFQSLVNVIDGLGIRYLIIFLFSLLFLTACEENKPVIPPLLDVEMEIEEEESEDLVRKVLIEEFTGVRCVNCPQGSEEVENLRAIHGDNLIAVGIHAGSFSQPYDESTIDFQTEAGDAIINFLGVPLGYPSAVISRTVPEGRTRLQTGQSSWAGLIQQELEKETVIDLKIENNFQVADNELVTTIEIIPTEDINEDLRLSVMVVETDIENTQLTPAGKQDDYLHRHNLRAMLTNSTGDALSEKLLKDTPVERTYNFTIPTADVPWKPEDVSIIAFVHSGGATKEVLQVEEVKILE
ncbi:MAG: Omp28 family outer membrane lipoprotein [Saprospiraceae bacterium]